MALIIVSMFYGGHHFSNSQGSFLMDAAGEACGFIFQAPRTGNIDRAIFHTGTVTTAQNMTMSLEGVNTSGLPDGANYGGSTPGTWTPVDADDNVAADVAFGTAGAVTLGDLICIRFEWSGSAGNLNIINHAPGYGVDGLTRCFQDTGAGNVISNATPVLCLHYDDGTYVVPHWCSPPGNISNFNIDNTSNPREVGFFLRSPCEMTIEGLIYFMRDFATTEAINVNLYETPLGTPSAVRTVNATHDKFGGLNNGYVNFAPYTVIEGQEIAIGWSNPDTATDFSFAQKLVTNSDYWGGYGGGLNLVFASRATMGATSFTEAPTRKPLGQLLVTKIQSGSSSGGTKVCSF